MGIVRVDQLNSVFKVNQRILFGKPGECSVIRAFCVRVVFSVIYGGKPL